ncbi:AraC family transcriptional regulator [Kordiimonas aquimaris]|uniref:AraC family transcriptional regulator n=1 Tax=Kordiimonas aquimaris TaxID=707591 RepID=UPI0021D2A5BF|nr:helix-turn-helix domain-containing protein [Kordiimonas aquimaris]
MAEVTLITLDVVLRVSAISFLLLLGILIVRTSSDRTTGYLGLWSCISGATYLICSHMFLRDFFSATMPVVFIFCWLGQPAVWLFSLSQFQDKFRLWPWPVVITVLYFSLSRVHYGLLENQEWWLADAVWVIFSLLRFGLIAHMVFVAWQGRRDDLIETRRKFRTLYIVLVTLISVGITIAETWFEAVFETGGKAQALPLLLSTAMWTLSVILIWHVVTLRSGILFVGGKQMRRGQSGPQDPTERHDVETIKGLIEKDKLYEQAGLTISGLADQAGLPEHRMRRLINRHLGYRNFADFLNHYRITAAKDRLSSIEDRNLPVLTIAMDLGYGSLGPFNRAFKERTGLTPTAFRKKKLADN